MKCVPFALLATLIPVSPCMAGEPEAPRRFADRFQRLESENRQLRSELASLREAVQKLAEGASPDDCLSADIDNQGSLAWQKGGYEIVPYGIGWLNMAYDSSRTATGAFTVFVPSEEVQGEDSFTVNARATRFGIDVAGPAILSAASSGRIEFDFFGEAPIENRAGVLLRHAYGEFQTDEWRLVGGQTFDVISPLQPNTLNYTVGWGAGNMGYRRAQLRGERYLSLSNETTLILQGSLNRSVVTDFATEPLAGGEDAGWPTVMGRAAVKFDRWCDPSRAVEIGISGHVGEEAADFRTPPVEDDRRFFSWSLNADALLPLTDRMGFQGEFFIGEVTGTFQGGILQGIDPDLRNGIRALGGWVEWWYYLTDALHTHLGAGIDDPHDADLAAGRRSQNQFYFGNLIFDVTSLFRVGVEVSWWETRFVGLDRGETIRLETVMQYRF